MRSRICGVVGGAIWMVLVMGWPAERSHAQTEREGSYRRTISDLEISELVDGGTLDERDAYYCEKARDVCLNALCGSEERKNVQPTCWQHCTSDAYDKCVAKKRE